MRRAVAVEPGVATTGVRVCAVGVDDAAGLVQLAAPDSKPGLSSFCPLHEPPPPEVLIVHAERGRCRWLPVESFAVAVTLMLLSITSSGPSSTAYDKLTLTANGTSVQSFSNANKGSGYVPRGSLELVRRHVGHPEVDRYGGQLARHVVLHRRHRGDAQLTCRVT